MQREANSGLVMNEALKIAQGMREKKITPSRYGNFHLLQWETHRGRKYPNNTRVQKNTGRGLRMN